MFTTLRLEQDNGVAVLTQRSSATLDNPDKRNAMTPELTAELPRAVEAVRADAGVRALVLANTGTVFSAGGDQRSSATLGMLEQQLDWAPEENRRFMGDFYRAYLSLLKLDVPTIAAIGGHAIGAGVMLSQRSSATFGCDLRFASEGARFGITFLNLGLHPAGRRGYVGMATTHLLPQTVGYAHAADLIFTGRMIDAAEALQMGLVSRVLPADQLLEAALATAREIAQKPASAVRMAKRALVQHKLAGRSRA
jgi:enoyl-CoA hydratase